MLNKTKETMRSKSHENFMGGPSYDLSPFARLFVMAVSSFFGEDGYYSSTRRGSGKHISYLGSVFGSFGDALDELMTSQDRGESMRKAIEESMAYDAKLTLNFLVWLRTKALMRATPAVGLAVASHCPEIRGTGMLHTVSDKVLSRLDDVTNCLAYCLDAYGKPIPNSLKKALAKRLEKASEYELAKYAGKNKKVSLKSVIRLTHPHSDAIDKFCRENIYGRTVEAMAKEGREFKGVIFFGLMLTEDGPKVLEYNARFGDPEAQVVLPRLKTDIIDVCNACIDGTLEDLDLEFEDKAAVCVVLASDGYPLSYEKGKLIKGLENFKGKDGYYCFHAGTKKTAEGIVTNGGRVLGITAKGDTLSEARKKAYEATEWVDFENKYMRHDIGKAIDEMEE